MNIFNAITLFGGHHQVHNYISMLHSGSDKEFNQTYQEVHDEYFRKLQGKVS